MNSLCREAAFTALAGKFFDVLVIGGGATGCGIALDAASRGLKTLLVEKADFSSGTSSRSTKLIHGGVRYLEQAVRQLDPGQYLLVKEALHERRVLLEIAPHLMRWLPIMTPLYRKRDVPYYRAGLKIYDYLAGGDLAHPSYFLGRDQALERCPMLNPEGLRGGVVYYDGQFDDARMNVTLALSAEREGATVLNYAAVSEFLKTDGKITGATIENTLTGKKVPINCQIAINATGPFTDAVRRIDNPSCRKILSVSSGSHLILPPEYCPQEMGLLIPKTEDQRVLFLLPWLGYTLVGTTDNPAKVEEHPHPRPDDATYMLRQLARYFALKISPSAILAQWSGLRPLISELHESLTARLSREHALERSPSGLLSISGGKWTTYRRMAMDAVDEAIRIANLTPRFPNVTERLKLVGAVPVTERNIQSLVKEFGISVFSAKYLLRAYGERAWLVGALAAKRDRSLLVQGFPYLSAEVPFLVETESACFSVDILARRLRLLFLNTAKAKEAAAKVQAELQRIFLWNEKAVEEDTRRLTQEI